jgi:GDP-4-dehydro-6-deoxy-D-mannose reductase
VEIYGAVRAPVRENPGDVRYTEYDLSDAHSAVDCLRLSRPHLVFHLAARCPGHDPWSSPARSFAANVAGLLNLLEAVRGLKDAPQVVVAGCYRQYAVTTAGLLDESATGAAGDPLALSQFAQDTLAAQYAAGFGLPVIRTRLFPFAGPAPRCRSVASRLAHSVAAMEMGRQLRRMETPPLDQCYDLTDTRDVAHALWLTATLGEPGEAYNVASGHLTPVRRMVEILAGLSRVTFEVRSEMNAAEACSAGDAQRLRRQTGWRPEIALHQTMGDLLEGWRRRLHRGDPGW